MNGALLRRRRKRIWKSKRKWQKSLERKRRLEEELHKVRQYTEPDRSFNVKGLLVGVHILRDRFRGSTELRFEFFRKEGTKRLASDFGEHDLDALLKAVRCAKHYRTLVERKRRSAKQSASGNTGAVPSKA